jgi:3-deoxy-D-manno-octulosonic-acid transferase
MRFLETRLGSFALYDLLVPLGALVAAPAYLARSLKHPEYRAHIGERMGCLPADLRSRLGTLEKRPVWLQAVSVGEVMLARALIEAIASAGCDAPMVISSTTPAGRDTAVKGRSRSLVGVFHFPLDWSPFVRRALDVVRPSAFIAMETEIWPGLLTQCMRRRVPVLIANGRISPRSHARYLRLSRLLAGPLKAVRLACMQSADDAGRLVSIGVPEARVTVTGNMKFDAMPSPGADSHPGPMEDLRGLYGLPSLDAARVLVAGSTSPGEEEMILDAIESADFRGRTGGGGHAVHSGPPGFVMILAPRHRERFDEVAGILARRGVPFVRRTQLPSGKPRRVVLLDTVGELARTYALATVAFVGGSLVPRGGQNLIEPAAHGVPVVFGPATENFASVAEALIDTGAGFRVADAADLAATLGRLLSDPGLCRRAGQAGRALVEANRGATERTVHQLLPFLG